MARVCAVLAAVLCALGAGACKRNLSPPEQHGLKEFLAGLPPADRLAIETDLDAMPDAERADYIRHILSLPPAAVIRERRLGRAKKIRDELRTLNNALSAFYVGAGKQPGYNPSFAELKDYLAPGTTLYDTGADDLGDAFGPFTVDSVPLVPEATFNALSDVADANFWSPYR